MGGKLGERMLHSKEQERPGGTRTTRTEGSNRELREGTGLLTGEGGCRMANVPTSREGG